MWRTMDDKKKAQLIMETLNRHRASQNYLPGFRRSDPESLNRILAGVDCDEVYENIFIGDEYTAKSKNYLKILGITHVVNAAEGCRIGMVNTSAGYYNGTGITYLGLELMDLSVVDISKHFHEVSDFIETALRSGGKVLVHCMMGLSRSATFVLAFLMLKRGMTACEAMAYVRQRRNVHPNEGFVRCLASLDNKLYRKNYVLKEQYACMK